MQVIAEAQVGPMLTYHDLIPAMRHALIDFSSGVVVQPLRSVLAVHK